MDIVCVSSVDWEPLWTRKQQIMSRLPKYHRILYVEPPISFLSPYKDPSVAFKKRMAKVGIRQLNDNIWLLSPPVVLPLANQLPLINVFNQMLIAQSIKAAIKELGLVNHILWTYLHTSCDLKGRLGEKFLIYDCVDEHSAYDGFNPHLVKEMEKKLLIDCDLVFCTARGLYETKKEFCQKIFLSPNAADIGHFGQADSPETPLAGDLKGLSTPILGFVGAIKEWIDLDLIAELAKAFPQASIVMVGPVGANIDISKLNEQENIYFLGHRDRQILPQYLKGFDVCLNPFKENELTSTVSPLKFYEYLASGRPIASIPMPEIMEFEGLVEFGRGPKGFVDAVNRALGDTPTKKKKRLQKAGENSWESRAEFMLNKINEHIIFT